MKKIRKDQLQTGDLLFFSNRRGAIDHVGIYLEDGKFIHSARRKGVTISALEGNYWRARFAGSRRLASLGELDGDEFMETRGSFEFPLGLRSSVDFQFSGLVGNQSNTVYPFPGPVLPRIRSPQEPLYSFKLGYSHTLWNDRWNLHLNALWGRSYRNDSWLGFAPSTGLLWPAVLGYEDPYQDTVYSRGFEIASDIDLFRWLRITPSVAYLGDRDPEKDDFLPRGVLGLAANLGAPAGNYSISMAFRYARPENASAAYFLSPADRRDSLDMAFSLRYNLTKVMNLSVVGTQSLYDDLLTKGNGLTEAEAYRDLFFTLDFSY